MCSPYNCPLIHSFTTCSGDRKTLSNLESSSAKRVPRHPRRSHMTRRPHPDGLAEAWVRGQEPASWSLSRASKMDRRENCMFSEQNGLEVWRGAPVEGGHRRYAAPGSSFGKDGTVASLRFRRPGLPLFPRSVPCIDLPQHSTGLGGTPPSRPSFLFLVHPLRN